MLEDRIERAPVPFATKPIKVVKGFAMATGEKRVNWTLLGSGVFEDMVAVLLSHLHPGIVRVDGSGGDGGRDCFFNAEDGMEIWELKSFTRRLERTQRRQVERSLKKAAKHQPVRWYLVVPIDATPGEEDWFKKLSKKYAFPLTWKGKTWLDGEMAQRPYLSRYYIDGFADEILERLQELERENAALAAGVPDALDRLETIRQRLNELDPHYEFTVSVTPQGRTVDVKPRYAGAERDRPITIRLHGEFPDTVEGRRRLHDFEEALNFGLPLDLDSAHVNAVVVDAPAGLGGRFEDASLSMRPLGSEVRHPMHLKVRSPDGTPLAQLPVTIESRTSGLDGIVLTAHDRSRWLTVLLKLRYSDGRLDLTYRTQLDGPVLPNDLSPALAFVAVLREPNLLTVEVLEPPVALVTDLAIDAADIELGTGRRVDLVSECGGRMRKCPNCSRSNRQSSIATSSLRHGA